MTCFIAIFLTCIRETVTLDCVRVSYFKFKTEKIALLVCCFVVDNYGQKPKIYLHGSCDIAVVTLPNTATKQHIKALHSFTPASGNQKRLFITICTGQFEMSSKIG